jgi:hypothetical protein
MSFVATAIAYITGGAIMMSEVAGMMLLNAIVTVASTMYQRNRAAKAAKDAKAIADSQKGIQQVVDGVISNIPVIYGRNKVGGARVFSEVTDGFKWNTTYHSHSMNGNSGAENDLDPFTPLPALTEAISGSNKYIKEFLSKGGEFSSLVPSVYDTEFDSEMSFGTTFSYSVTSSIGDGGSDITASHAEKVFPYGSAKNVKGRIRVNPSDNTKATITIDSFDIELLEYDDATRKSTFDAADVFGKRKLFLEALNIDTHVDDRYGVAPGFITHKSQLKLKCRDLMVHPVSGQSTEIKTFTFKFESNSTSGGTNTLIVTTPPELRTYDPAAAPATDSQGNPIIKSYKSLSNNIGGDGACRQILHNQQIISCGNINDVYFVHVDEKPFNEVLVDSYVHASRIHVSTKGGKPDPLLAHIFGNAWNSPNDNGSRFKDTRAEARFEGFAFATGFFFYNRDTPQFQGVPTLQFFAEGRTLRSFDASGTLSSIETYSNNPSLVLLDYLTNVEYGKGLQLDQIDLTSFYEAYRTCNRRVQAASNITTEKPTFDVPIHGGLWEYKTRNTTIKRPLYLYECNMGIDTSKAVVDNIELILETMGAAELVWSSGKYSLRLSFPTVYTIENPTDNATNHYCKFTANSVGPSNHGVIDSSYKLDDPTRYTNRDVVQFDYIPDDPSTRKLYRVTKATGFVTLPPARVDGTLNSGWTDEPSNGLIAAVITDDDIILGESIAQIFPSSQQRFNYCTVKFLNEDKDFAEDSISWPPKYKQELPTGANPRGAWIGTPWTQKYNTGDYVTFNGNVYFRKSPTFFYEFESEWNEEAKRINPKPMSYNNPVEDSSWIKVVDNIVYSTYLKEDSNVASEKEVFQAGDSTIYHANNTAENLVRLSRDAIVYKFSLDRSFSYLEPGDFLKILSDTLDIPGELVRIEEITVNSKNNLEIQAVKFDARNLAWNAADSQIVTPTFIYDKGMKQAYNLQFVRSSSSLTSVGAITWDASTDVRVTHYLIYKFDEMKVFASPDSDWKEVGSVKGTLYEVPVIADGTYTYAVVAAGSNVTASRSGWPYVEVIIEAVLSGLYTEISVYQNTYPNVYNTALGRTVNPDTGEITYKDKDTDCSLYNLLAPTDLDSTNICVYDFRDDTITHPPGYKVAGLNIDPSFKLPTIWHRSRVKADKYTDDNPFTNKDKFQLYESKARILAPTPNAVTTSKITWSQPDSSSSDFQELIVYTRGVPRKIVGGDDDGKFEKPLGGSYDFSKKFNRLTPPSSTLGDVELFDYGQGARAEWTEAVPPGVYQLYYSYGTAFVTSFDKVDDKIDWSFPEIVRTAGTSQIYLQIYTRADLSLKTAKPAFAIKGDCGSYNFDTKVLIPPEAKTLGDTWYGVKWYGTVEEARADEDNGANPVLYTSYTTAQVTSFVGVDSTLEWTAAVVDGSIQPSRQVVEIFTRDPSVMAPDYCPDPKVSFEIPDSSYFFGSDKGVYALKLPTVGEHSVWKHLIPAVEPNSPNTKVYVSVAIAEVLGTGTVENPIVDDTLEWLKPVEWKNIGTSMKEVKIYTTNPIVKGTYGFIGTSESTGGSYNFGTGVLTKPSIRGTSTPGVTTSFSDWLTTPPTSTEATVYSSTAIAQVSGGSAGKDITLEWSAPVKDISIAYNAVSAILTNESHTIATTPEGTQLDAEGTDGYKVGADGKMVVFYGGIEVTDGLSFRVLNHKLDTLNATVTIGSDQIYQLVSFPTTDTHVVDIEASFTPPGQATSMKIRKSFTVTKAKGGTTAKVLRLNATGHGFQFAEDNSTCTFPSTGKITFTPTVTNVTTPSFTYVYAPTPAVVAGVTAPAVTGSSSTITAEQFGNNNAMTVTCTCSISGVNSDTITIIRTRQGISAPMVNLVADSYVVTYNKEGTLVGSGIPLRAELLGGLTYSLNGAWAVVDSAGTTANVGGTLDVGENASNPLSVTNTFTPSASYDAAKTISKITYVHTDLKYADTVTIISVKDGAQALIGYLTNESVVLTSNEAGVVTKADMDKASGTFKVFYGNQDVTTACTFSVYQYDGTNFDYFDSVNKNNLNTNTIGYITFGTGANTGKYTVSSDASGGMQGVTIMDTTINAAYTPVAGTTYNIQKTLTIAKAQPGISRGLSLAATESTILTDSLGYPPAAKDITITAAPVNFQNTPSYSWTKREDGVIDDTFTTSNSNTMTHSVQTTDTYKTVTYTCSATEAVTNLVVTQSVTLACVAIGATGNYIDYIFASSQSTPDTPTGNDPTASVNSIWKDTPDNNSNTWWQSQALKNGVTNAVIGTWTAPVPLFGTDIQVVYQVSNSSTAEPTGDWTTAMPEKAASQFMWAKTGRRSPGITTWTYDTAVCISNEGTHGLDAVALSISADSHIISYSTLNVRKSAATIKVKASLLGELVDKQIDWSMIDASEKASFAATGNPVYTTTTSPNSTHEVTIYLSTAYASNEIKITAVHTAGIYADTISIIRIKDGDSSLTGYLTNESVVVSATDTGVVSMTNMAFATGYFKVFYGEKNVSSECNFTVTDNFYADMFDPKGRATINNTSGSVDRGKYTSTCMAGIGMIDVDIVDATLNAYYTSPLGQLLVISKVLTVAKSREGRSIRSVAITGTADVVAASNDYSTNLSDVQISLRAIPQGFTNVSYTYAWTCSTNNLSFVALSSTKGESSSGDTLFLNTTTFVGEERTRTFRCIVTSAAAESAVSTFTITRMPAGMSGSSPLIMDLDNDNETYPLGHLEPYTAYATNTMRGLANIFMGATDVTTLFDFTTANSLNCTGSASLGAYYISSISQDTGYLLITATGKSGTSFAGKTVWKRFTFSVARGGEDGTQPRTVKVTTSANSIKLINGNITPQYIDVTRSCSSSVVLAYVHLWVRFWKGNIYYPNTDTANSQDGWQNLTGENTWGTWTGDVFRFNTMRWGTAIPPGGYFDRFEFMVTAASTSTDNVNDVEDVIILNDGVTKYTWTVFTDDKVDGTLHIDNSGNYGWMGIYNEGTVAQGNAVVTDNATKPNSNSDYKWTYIRGPRGANAITCYFKTDNPLLGAGGTSIKIDNDFYGDPGLPTQAQINQYWITGATGAASRTPPEASAGYNVWVSFGERYAGYTIWAPPMVNKLVVNNLQAVSTVTGALTVNDTLTLVDGCKLVSGTTTAAETFDPYGSCTMTGVGISKTFLGAIRGTVNFTGTSGRVNYYSGSPRFLTVNTKEAFPLIQTNMSIQGYRSDTHGSGTGSGALPFLDRFSLTNCEVPANNITGVLPAMAWRAGGPYSTTYKYDLSGGGRFYASLPLTYWPNFWSKSSTHLPIVVITPYGGMAASYWVEEDNWLYISSLTASSGRYEVYTHV